MQIKSPKNTNLSCNVHFTYLIWNTNLGFLLKYDLIPILYKVVHYMCVVQSALPYFLYSIVQTIIILTH